MQRLIVFLILVLGGQPLLAQDDVYNGPIDIPDSTAFLGVYFVQMNPYFAEEYNLPTSFGALVQKIVICSAAQRKKIRPLDYIMAINGKEFTYYQDMRWTIQNRYKPGDPIVLTILREGKVIKENVILGSRADICDEETQPVCMGFSFQSSALNRLQISNLETGYAAEQMGMLVQDELVSINNFPIRSPNDLQFVLKAFEPYDDVNVVVRRNGSLIELKGPVGSCDEPLVVPEKEARVIIPKDSTTHKEPEKIDYSNRKVVVGHTYETWKNQVTLRIWDHQQQDGDTIILEVNGVVMLNHYPLKKQGETITVNLKKGKNTIKLIAVNLGSIPPNTAAFRISDGEHHKIVVLRSDMNTSEAIEIYHK